MYQRFYVSAWVTASGKAAGQPPAIIVGLIARSATEAQDSVKSTRTAGQYAAFEVTQSNDDWAEALSLADFVTYDGASQVASVV